MKQSNKFKEVVYIKHTKANITVKNSKVNLWKLMEFNCIFLMFTRAARWCKESKFGLQIPDLSAIFTKRNDPQSIHWYMKYACYPNKKYLIHNQFQTYWWMFENRIIGYLILYSVITLWNNSLAENSLQRTINMIFLPRSFKRYFANFFNKLNKTAENSGRDKQCLFPPGIKNAVWLYFYVHVVFLVPLTPVLFTIYLVTSFFPEIYFSQSKWHITVDQVTSRILKCFNFRHWISPEVK